MLSNALSKLDKTLKRYNPKLSLSLNSPKSEAELISFFSSISINSDDLIELYKWHNGSKIEINESVISIDLCSEGAFLPIEISNHYYLENEIYTSFRDKKYFPIISNFYGDILLFNGCPQSSSYENILIHSPSLFIDEPISYCDDLVGFVNSINECYDKKIYISKENEIDIDFEKESSVFSIFNPQSDFWNFDR